LPYIQYPAEPIKVHSAPTIRYAVSSTWGREAVQGQLLVTWPWIDMFIDPA
jgi:hypothetical protein